MRCVFAVKSLKCVLFCGKTCCLLTRNRQLSQCHDILWQPTQCHSVTTCSDGLCHVTLSWPTLTACTMSYVRISRQTQHTCSLSICLSTHFTGSTPQCHWPSRGGLCRYSVLWQGPHDRKGSCLPQESPPSAGPGLLPPSSQLTCKWEGRCGAETLSIQINAPAPRKGLWTSSCPGETSHEVHSTQASHWEGVVAEGGGTTPGTPGKKWLQPQMDKQVLKTALLDLHIPDCTHKPSHV